MVAVAILTPSTKTQIHHAACRLFRLRGFHATSVRDIAEAVGLPIFLYDVPSRTVCGLADETIARLAEHPRCIGLKDATVEFESLEAKVSASGAIQEDGSFRLTTEQPGDGAWLGKHKVLIARHYPNPDTAAPRVIHSRYESFETSGLEAEVEAKSNTIVFKVERLKGKRK